MFSKLSDEAWRLDLLLLDEVKSCVETLALTPKICYCEYENMSPLLDPIHILPSFPSLFVLISRASPFPTPSLYMSKVMAPVSFVPIDQRQ